MIVLASTDFDPHQAEERTITAVSGNALTLDKPLQYMHFGEITYGVDERGEVGLLTRNIRIQASDDAEKSYFGGHIMAMAGSKMYVSGVELNRMGQNMHLARYPIHWHIVGDGQGQYIENSSIHDTYSRCVTVHGTNNVRVAEQRDLQHRRPLLLPRRRGRDRQPVRPQPGDPDQVPSRRQAVRADQPRPAQTEGGKNFESSAGQAAKDILIPSDNTASTFLDHQSRQHLPRQRGRGVRARSASGSPCREHPTGAFLDKEGSANIWPRRTAVREFSGNTAHSNFDGFMFDRGPKPDGTFSVGGSNYHAPSPIRPTRTAPPKGSVFENFTSYKNRHGGIWGRGEMAPSGT